MLKRYWEPAKKVLYKIRAFFVAKIGKLVLRSLLWTCRFEVQGAERFREAMQKDKCMLMLWHNRLAIGPFILDWFIPGGVFTALISASRDGDMINNLVCSYKNGRTLRVAHQGRYEALRQLVQHVEESSDVIVICPDGPRGPRYVLKPGIAVAALETKAAVVVLNWCADRFWEFKSWDRLRIPKPFSKIRVEFGEPVRFDESPALTLKQAQAILQDALPID